MSKVLLGEIAIERKETCKGNKNGFPIVGLEHLTPEQVTLSDWDEDRSNTFTKLFYEGDILFGRRRAYLKKAAVAPFNGICSGDITVIKAIPERILPELLPFVIQNDSFFQYAVGKSAGSLSPRVKWEYLRNYEFELPNLDKQRELAKVLWAIDDTKKSYLDLSLKTEELAKVYFFDLIGDLNTNSKGWPRKPLNECCEIINGYAFKSNFYVEDGIRIIRITNVKKGFVDGTNPKYYPIELKDEFLKFMLKENDILLSLTGNVGRVGLLHQELLPAALNQRVACVRIKNEEKLNRLFLFSIFNSEHFENDCIKSSQGIAQKNMSTEWLKTYSIPFPPEKIQNEFALFIQQIDKVRFELRHSLEELASIYLKLITENFE